MIFENKLIVNNIGHKKHKVIININKFYNSGDYKD